MTGKGMRKEDMTSSRGPRVGLEHSAAAARTQPIYVGYMLYQLSYCDACIVFF